jgi:hypothetical protein
MCIVITCNKHNFVCGLCSGLRIVIDSMIFNVALLSAEVMQCQVRWEVDYEQWEGKNFEAKCGGLCRGIDSEFAGCRVWIQSQETFGLPIIQLRWTTYFLDTSLKSVTTSVV